MRIKTLIVGGFATLALGGGIVGAATASFADGAPVTSKPSAVPSQSSTPTVHCPKWGTPRMPRACAFPARPGRPIPGHPTYTG